MEITKAFRHATVVTMDGGRVVEDATLLIAGTTILGLHSESDVPADARSWMDSNPASTVDVTGKFIFPGLINLHEHLDMHEVPGSMHDRVSHPVPKLAARAARNALLALAHGVTTLRDLGSRDSTNVIIREVIEQGFFVGPRVLACGQMISATGGHGQPLCAEGDGPDDLRRVTRQQIKSGADVIKVCASGGVVAMPRENPWAQQLSDNELRTIVEEADRFGLRVAAHAQPPAAIKASVLAGVTTIEHGAFLDDECAELMVEHGTYLVPTIDDSFAVAELGDLHGRPAWMQENARKSIPLRQASLRRAVEARVRLGVGTDVVGKMGREMAHLVEAGADVTTAIAGATSTAAEILGVEEIGSLRPGKAADLIVLSEDARSRLTAFDDAIELVVRAGRAIAPQALLDVCNDGTVVR